VSKIEQARIEQARIEQARIEQARIEQARIEQVRKGGLPPLATDLSCRVAAGVNHPSLLVRFWLVRYIMTIELSLSNLI